MCECLKSVHVMAGWGCCACRKYNGLQRLQCSGCGRFRCSPLQRVRGTDEQFESYAEAYRDDPARLAMVPEALRGVPSKTAN